MTVELKPCPFCGGEAETTLGPIPGKWGARCKECDVWRDDREAAEAEAIAAWNARTVDPAAIREAALREAADSLLEASVWCESQEQTTSAWHNGVVDARKHHISRILALIDKEPGHG